VSAFHLEPGAIEAGEAGAAFWRSRLGVAPADEPGFVLLADPFTFDSEGLVRALDMHYPLASKAGGLASGGRQPGANALYFDGRSYSSGAVGFALTGEVEVDTVVAQGCRPIGSPMFVTRCQDNLLQGLDGRSPYEVLADIYESLAPRDRELFQHSLFLGIVMRPERQQHGQGDFLVRNIVGADPKSGVLAIGAPLEMHMVVQFHLRDAQTSHDDLAAMLTRYRRESSGTPRGALLFSCLGRGQFLYGRPDHDTKIFRDHLGHVPLGGFFCNGEIGPVDGRTFLHGYTSSFALFRKKGVGGQGSGVGKTERSVRSVSS
jgi:small ligand-binding sensory domain FIST